MDFRKLSDQERYVIRKRAVSLIDTGSKQVFIAELFGVRTATVSEWVKSYKLMGLKGLRDNKRGAKSESQKLLTKQLYLQYLMNCSQSEVCP